MNKRNLLVVAFWALSLPCLFLLEYFINDTVNIGFIAVGMTASGVQSLYEGLKVRKLSLTVIGAIQTLIALIAILAFVGQVVLQ